MRGPGFVLFEDGRIVSRVEQAALLAEVRGRAGRPGSTAHRERHLSGGEALATLGTTTAQYLPAVLAGHAGPEAMGTLALEYAGLECSFHVIGP